MPIYEYDCQSCKRKTEVIQRVGEALLKVCPHCGGKLKKAFSAPAIQFKGSGWYITDYARAKKEEKAVTGEKAEAAGEKAEAAGEKAEAAGGKPEAAGGKPEKKKEAKEKKTAKD